MSDGTAPPLPVHAQVFPKADFPLPADFDRARKGAAERGASNKGAKASDRDGQRTNYNKASLTDNFDSELYGNGGGDKFAGYNTSIAVDDDMEVDGDEEEDANAGRLIGQYTATADQIGEWATGEAAEDDMINSREKQAQIQNRETDYQRKRFQRRLSGGAEGKTYKEQMQERELEREEERVKRAIEDKRKDQIARGEEDMDIDEAVPTLKDAPREESPEAKPRRRTRKRGWDADETVAEGESGTNGESKENGDAANGDGKKKKSRWDASSGADAEDGSSYNAEGQLVDAEGELISGGEVKAAKKKSRWDSTAAPDAPVTTNGDSEAPKRRSKWDVAGPAGGADGSASGGMGSATPSQQVMPFGTDVNSRNAPISDEELDELLPSEGYQILVPPPGYEPLRAPAKRVAPSATPLPTGGFMNQEPVDARAMGKQLPSEIPGVGDLQFFKNEDMQYFGKLVDGADENDLSVEELKQRKIMRLLLKVKNGTPPMRKTALRQLTDNARNFGAGPLFDQILPLLMEKSLEDQERHLLVKVIDRVLYKLDDLVRPYTHRILVVIEPLLIDQDYYARVEGREIISNLAKAAGLAHMISTMRPDIDHVDEYVRNTTARAFAVVASALGIPTLLPFLKAVCKSKKSWQARHTGVKIVQQIPILMGCAVLPHLKGLVDCIGDNLNDEQTKVRTVTSLALAALAEASNPFGIESFDEILNPLWTGARKQRGKGLAGFLKAVGYIIPLMDEEYSNYYTSQIMEILIREFQSPDEEMKKVVLKVVSQCAGTSGVTAGYLKETVLDDFFKFFWVRRMALDRRNYKQVVETTVDLGNKVGVGEIVDRIVGNLKDESEAYRKMTVETIEKVISAMGAADINERLEERLVDGILHSFQEQSVEDIVLLNGFGTVVNALGTRCKPYLPQIVSTILWRLNNKSATVRQQAADLISRIAVVMKQCGEDALMGKLGTVLYEYLGEEYPEVLGSILGAMRSIVTVVGINSMQPPIKDLLPRITPILRNRHEKVQENTIDLVGRIADRGPESVNAREWMRICFELLDMLKAHKKGIRRAANNTFGFIAKAIGPQDVLATLLNNLRVQDRQSRVCTAVAIGIVAETCAPFTVLPALMNEYRVPELNVQNGVLKALSFLFEYIGEMGKDYVYAVTPLLEDALVDRDQVHRQTGASVVKHMALGVVGLGCEDAMLHLLNLLIPNLFETSPHVIDRVIEAIDAIRVAVGTGAVLNYVWAGLFHPARKVRTPYWRLYNDAYVMSADAMVPYYPPAEEKIERRELMIMI
jgi:splicing factor 3B subunit 1